MNHFDLRFMLDLVLSIILLSSGCAYRLGDIAMIKVVHGDVHADGFATLDDGKSS